MNRRDLLRHTATAGLLAAPAAAVLAAASTDASPIDPDRTLAEPQPSTTRFTPVAALAATGVIDLIARGLVAGATDTHAAANTTVWQDATAEAAATGGTIYLPGSGVYRFTGGLHLDDRVRYLSDGATLTLANGANRDLLRTRGFENLWGTSSREGPAGWSLEGFTLDGNRVNQSSGCYPLSLFGRGFTLERVQVRNGRGGGLRAANGPGGAHMEARLRDVSIYDNHRTQLEWRGPNDSQMSDVIVFATWDFHNGGRLPGATAVHLHTNANGTQVDRLHVWGFHERGVVLGSTGLAIYNGVSEGAQINVLVAASSTIYEGTIFGTAGTGPYAGSEVGYRLGTAGSGVTHWNNRLRGTLHRFAAGDKPIELVTDNGTDIDACVLASASGGAVFGHRDYKTSVNIMCPDQPRFSERMGGFSGVGAPNPQLGVVGSLYTRRDGGDGSFLYRKTSATAWRAIL